MMAQTGVVRFHGNLDPAAQEFRPARNPNPPFFAPLPLPPPPPPPQQQQLYYPPPAYEVQVVPFQYHHQQHHAAPPPPAASVAPPLPPPSPTATRALALGPVPGDASESWVRRELEVFGDVRAVQMERARRDGVVTVHFYDLRHAKRALRAIREQHMQRQCRLRDHYGALPAPAAEEPCCLGGAPAGLAAGPPAVWAQFVIPAVHAIPEGQNQGTIVVFNLDPEVSAAILRELFDPFGPVKELRETPFKKHQRFVEFYDVRDAAKALAQMNGKEIRGKNVVIEFSRPGGYNRKFLLDAASPNPFAHDSSYLYNSPAATYHAKIPNNSPPPPPPPPPLPLPRRAASPLGLRILQPSKADKKQLSGLGEASPNVAKSSVVEASMSRLSLSGGDAHRSERVDGEYCNKGSVVTARKSAKKRQGNSVKQQQSQSCRSSSGSSSGRPWKSNKQGRHKLDSRFVISEEGDAAVAEASSGDSRTTVMIKNIPNKYSQKLLLNMLDNHCIHCNEQVGEDHCEDDDRQPLSAYDFVYLPIDFNNKCNVGYGFVNMTTPQAARRLYKAFHLRHWEVFNSRKICEVTYARIQGLEALKEHFKNSKFPSEAEHYLPVVFSPPRDGRRLTEPLPVVGQPPPQQQQQRQRREGDNENEMEGGDERAGIDGNDVCCSEEGDGGCRGSGSQSSNGGDNGDDDGDKEKN
ncbi:protein terminal ear1 [Rhodamnia argentea]|uniref:Protein terminal ear1 n=1 Tax=Rhodamnia argentea TaxID=178133 RepID=A0A8B8QQD2_9MYRT|nr:protein terminal ear1 [Rhodamnia argentea]